MLQLANPNPFSQRNGAQCGIDSQEIIDLNAKKSLDLC